MVWMVRKKTLPKGVQKVRTTAQVVGWASWIVALLILAVGGYSSGVNLSALAPGIGLVLFLPWMAVILTATNGRRGTRGESVREALLTPWWPWIAVWRHLRRRRDAQAQVARDHTVGTLDALTGEAFEVRLSLLFRQLGYEVSTTPRSGDFGADLLMTDRDGQRWAVQAKRYQQAVGVSAVQEVLAAVSYYGVHRGMVVTNSSFTPAAQALANKTGVVLWDRDALAHVMARVGPHDAASAAPAPDPLRALQRVTGRDAPAD